MSYRHPKERKLAAVERIRARETYAKVAGDLGISKGLLHYWGKHAKYSASHNRPKYKLSSQPEAERVSRFAAALWESEFDVLGDSVPRWDESSNLWLLAAREAAMALRRLFSHAKSGKKLTVTACGYCGLPFRRHSRRRRFCSRDCMKAASPAVYQRKATCERCGGAVFKAGSLICFRCKMKAGFYRPRPTVYDRICEICGKPFQTKEKTKSTCSRECLIEWRRRADWKPKMVTRTPCPVCGTGVNKNNRRDVCSRCSEKTFSLYPEVAEIKRLNLELKRMLKGEKTHGTKTDSPQHGGHPPYPQRGNPDDKGGQVHALAGECDQ